MPDIAGSRRLVVLSLNPTEYFVRGEGSESDVRGVIGTLLPNAEFELSSIDDRAASSIESRLQPPQQELLKNLASQGGAEALEIVPREVQDTTRGGKRTDRRSVEVGGGRRVGYLSLRSADCGNPQASARRDGPVSVTVGVGIAGKF